MKAQMVIELETGLVLCTDVDKGRVHDFKLLKRSRLPFVSSQLCLADKGYQGFSKRHRAACLPTKKPRNQPLPEAEKQHNRVVSQKQGSGKVGKLKNSSRLSHVCSFPIQMATLFARCHFAECPLVLPLRLELS